MSMLRTVVSMFVAGVIALNASGVSSQDFPTKPIRIVTTGAGSGNDFNARLIAQGLTESFGQPVIVENRSGTLPGEVVSKAPPDGYTLLASGGTLWIEPLLRKTPYDPLRDFSPITLVASSPNVLVVHPSVPAKSVKELIALAKARPGELNNSMGAVGGSGHITAELFKAMAGIRTQNVPYKSDSQEIGDLVSGYVQLSFQGGAKVAPYLRSGRLRALGITSAQPSALFPGLPPIAATVPGFESVQMQSILAPAKTPVAIVNRLNQEIVRVLKTPEAKEKFFSVGVEPVANSPETFAAIMKADIAKLGKLIKDAGIKAE